MRGPLTADAFFRPTKRAVVVPCRPAHTTTRVCTVVVPCRPAHTAYVYAVHTDRHTGLLA
eukprot:4505366-Pleurochrysis_carterae.AAC.1